MLNDLIQFEISRLKDLMQEDITATNNLTAAWKRSIALAESAMKYIYSSQANLNGLNEMADMYSKLGKDAAKASIDCEEKYIYLVGRLAIVNDKEFIENFGGISYADVATEVAELKDCLLKQNAVLKEVRLSLTFTLTEITKAKMLLLS